MLILSPTNRLNPEPKADPNLLPLFLHHRENCEPPKLEFPADTVFRSAGLALYLDSRKLIPAVSALSKELRVNRYAEVMHSKVMHSKVPSCGSFRFLEVLAYSRPGLLGIFVGCV
jgi:hypothetical protein